MMQLWLWADNVTAHSFLYQSIDITVVATDSHQACTDYTYW